MFKQSQGCCGLKAEPIRHPVLAKHECKLITSSKISGHLNILSVGLTFEQWTYNPFTNPLQIMLPQSDIKSFDTRIFEN